VDGRRRARRHARAAGSKRWEATTVPNPGRTWSGYPAVEAQHPHPAAGVPTGAAHRPGHRFADPASAELLDQPDPGDAGRVPAQYHESTHSSTVAGVDLPDPTVARGEWRATTRDVRVNTNQDLIIINGLTTDRRWHVCAQHTRGTGRVTLPVTRPTTILRGPPLPSRRCGRTDTTARSPRAGPIDTRPPRDASSPEPRPSSSEQPRSPRRPDARPVVRHE
jgi:hypothetical protein